MAFLHVGIEIEFKGKGLDEKGIIAACNNDKYQLEIGKEILHIDPRYFRPSEVDLLVGDPSKAKNKLGWEPKIDLKKLVEDMMESDIERMQKESYLKSSGYDTLNYFE